MRNNSLVIESSNADGILIESVSIKGRSYEYFMSSNVMAISPVVVGSLNAAHRFWIDSDDHWKFYKVSMSLSVPNDPVHSLSYLLSNFIYG